jgi:hypothetical protein
MKKSASIATVVWIVVFVVSLVSAGAMEEEKDKNAERGKQAGAGVTKRAEKEAGDSNVVLNRMERNREREAKALKDKVEEKKGLKEKGAAEAEEKGKEAVGKMGRGKEHQQQLQAKDKQLMHEKSKHLKRAARLNRIRELAEKKGDTKTVQRVDELLKKEKERFSTKQGRIEGKIEKTGQAELKEKAEKAESAGKDVEEKVKEKEVEVKDVNK